MKEKKMKEEGRFVNPITICVLEKESMIPVKNETKLFSKKNYWTIS